MKRLFIWMFGRPVGTWSVARNGTHTFQYDETWLASGDSFPISLSIPLGKGVIEGSYIHDFFDNLLPDSEAIRNHMRIRFQAKSLAAFDLLHEVGRDAVGSMQILPEGELPSTGEITGRVIDEHEIAQTLRGLTQLTSVESVPVDEFRISLPGAQEKIALLKYQGQWIVPHGSTPTTHILKVPLGSFGPLGIDMSSSVENEYLCAKLTKALGIAVAECEIEQFEEIPTLVVTRFDRRWSEDGKQVIRIPQEDFCQVTKTSRADKYESDGGPGIQTIMSILQGSQNASEDRLTFFSAQLLFWLLAAPDGHAKNFSIFLGSGGRYMLAPLYDIISAYPVLGSGRKQIHPSRLKMAMALQGENRYYNWDKILPRHFVEMGRKYGLDVPTIFQDLAGRIPFAVEAVSNELSPNFPQSVSEPIFEGLIKQGRMLEGFTG